ncbi:MAG: hypothetical protein AB7F94_05605 [Nitrospira sp.]
MLQKQKMGFIIAVVSFLMVTVSFTGNANAVSGNEGGDDPSMMKREQDGSVSKKEFMKHHEWMFDQNDKNKNGHLDLDEMKNLHEMVKKMQERFDERHGQKH